MTLTTHIVVGSAIAAPFISAGHPVVGVVAGLASHYALDMIPHWGYRLNSIVNSQPEVRGQRKFGNNIVDVLLDVSKTALDFLIGFSFVLATLVTSGNFSIPILLAGIAGALPDGLQGLQLFYKKFPSPQLQKFHDYFHFDNGGVHDLPMTPKRLGFQLLLIIIGLIVIRLI